MNSVYIQWNLYKWGTSISGAILCHLCSLSFEFTSINGEMGNGGLKISQNHLSIRINLYNWGTRYHFPLILSLYVVNYTILIEQSKGD